MSRFLLLPFVFLCWQTTFSQQNVILIIADDVGIDYFGFYENHHDTASFPNLRRLISHGVVFDNATSNPLCSPTRAGILTGRYGFRTGILDVVTGTSSSSLDTSEMVIPKILKASNSSFKTANIGKWHLNAQVPASNLLIPNLIGYDHYAGNFLGAISSYTNWSKVTNGISSTSTTYATTETTNDAISWISSVQNNPFFLWMAYNAPHSPFHLPPTDLHSYSNLSGTTADINANPKEYFKASLEALDHEIGRLFDSLVLYNLFDNTNIIFIGDNGNSLRTSQIDDTTKTKGTVYQNGVHIPFLISGPAVVNPNRHADELVNTVDLFSTILELSGISNWESFIPSDTLIDSKSVFPILQNQSIEVRPWAFTELFFETTNDYRRGIRNKNYKFIYNSGSVLNSFEFYDLSNDPWETTDLLLGSLNEIQGENYSFLCSELFTLIEQTSNCTEFNNIDENDSDFLFIENPFGNKIENPAPNFTLILKNNLGQIIYEGKEIHLQNFDSLDKGLYFLTVNSKTIKLVKE